MKVNALLALRKQADALYTRAVRSTNDRDPINVAELRSVERALAQGRATVATVTVERGIDTRGDGRPWRLGIRIMDNGNEDVRGCRRATSAAWKALRAAGLHSDRMSVVDARRAVSCRPWGKAARGSGRKLEAWEKRHNEYAKQPSVVSASMDIEEDAAGAVEIALRAITQSLMNDGYRVEVSRAANVFALPAKTGVVERTARSKKTPPVDIPPAKRESSGGKKRNSHWEALPPGTPYPSPKSAAPCKLKHLGATVLGRGGGVVTACATPSRERPREGQYWIGNFATGHPMRRTVVARRVRNAATYGQFDAFAAVQAAELAKRDRAHVPSPIGTEFPHRPGTSPCDPEHGVWSDWAEAYETAKEKAAIETEGQDEAAYDRAVLDAMKQHPKFALWDRTERACIDGIEQRRRQRAPKAGMSIHRERALERIAFINAGGDPTSSDWTDRLETTKGKKRKLRYHKAA